MCYDLLDNRDNKMKTSYVPGLLGVYNPSGQLYRKTHIKIQCNYIVEVHSMCFRNSGAKERKYSVLGLLKRIVRGRGKGTTLQIKATSLLEKACGCRAVGNMTDCRVRSDWCSGKG